MPIEPSGPDAQALANIRTLDLAVLYDAQKQALEVHFEGAKTDIFVASYLVWSLDSKPDILHPSCVWTEGADSLLPRTELVRLLRDPEGRKEIQNVTWSKMESIVGHLLQATNEDPPRVRVTAFPSAAEWQQLSDNEQRIT